MKRLLLLSAIVATALAFGACGSDDDAAPPPPAPTVSFPFTDGDGIPELREFPNFSPSIVSRGSNVTVDVHVDSDTTDVQVDLGMFDSVLNQTFLTIFSGVRSVTPGAVNGITIMVPPGATPGTYVAKIDTCLDGLCLGGTSVGRQYVPFAIYQIFDLAAAAFLMNIFEAPTEFTVQ